MNDENTKNVKIQKLSETLSLLKVSMIGLDECEIAEAVDLAFGNLDDGEDVAETLFQSIKMAKEVERERVSDLIHEQATECWLEARCQGFEGDKCDYEITAADCESIVKAVGRKPTRREWVDAGYPYIGGAHVL